MSTFTQLAEALTRQPLLLFGAVLLIGLLGWLYAAAAPTRRPATREVVVASRPERRRRVGRVGRVARVRGEDGEPTVLLDRSVPADDVTAPMAQSRSRRTAVGGRWR